MAKCCGDSCACRIISGADVLDHDAIQVTGTGTVQDSFVITFVGVDADATTDLNIIVTWDPGRGYVISGQFASSSKLDSIGDVNAAAPTNGQVLAWNNATSKWVPANPTTASAGSVQHDQSLSGDGSVGTPLDVAHASGKYTQTYTSGGTGIGLTEDAIQQLVRSFTNDTQRGTADPAPQLNAISMLDSAPGLIDYWNGTDWMPLLVVGTISATEYLALSGSYDGRSTKMVVKQLSVTTGSDGSFIALSVADLTGAAGVVTCWIQPVGSPGFVAVLDDTDTTQVAAFAYALDGSGPLVSQNIQATVTALTY